ncbi:MAG TPA: RsmD family RNA methyltransferase, partial [Acidimicrobiia bacterium]|nr:RsmD family RNA methyltransferase [Acidimicrobiia bacterium]
RANLETTGTATNARVVPSGVEAFLARTPPPEAPFDLVWCDPPYGADPTELDRACEALRRPGWLTSDARIVLERPARGRAVRDEPRDHARAGGGAFEVTWEREYGDTLVTVLRSRERPCDRA